MPRTNEGMTNYPKGICLDMTEYDNLTDEKFIPGHRTAVSIHDFASADLGKVCFIAPYPCKIIRAYERHLTVAGQAGTLTLEKVPSGTAPGSGTVAMATTVDLTGTINTNQIIASLTTSAAILAVGDAIATKLASGASTSLAGASMTIILEWT